MGLLAGLYYVNKQNINKYPLKRAGIVKHAAYTVLLFTTTITRKFSHVLNMCV